MKYELEKARHYGWMGDKHEETFIAQSDDLRELIKLGEDDQAEGEPALLGGGAGIRVRRIRRHHRLRLGVGAERQTSGRKRRKMSDTLRGTPNHLAFPSRCQDCFREGKEERNEYWADGTYGCKHGHVFAYTNDGIIWWKAIGDIHEGGEKEGKK